MVLFLRRQTEACVKILRVRWHEKAKALHMMQSVCIDCCSSHLHLSFYVGKTLNERMRACVCVCGIAEEWG